MRESLFYFLNIWRLQRNVVHLQYNKNGSNMKRGDKVSISPDLAHLFSLPIKTCFDLRKRRFKICITK